MEKKTNVNINIDFSLCSMLALTFIILKLTSVIDWSWWVVCIPLYVKIVTVAIRTIFTKLKKNKERGIEQ